MTLARAIIAYLGGLELAVGDHDGEPFTVLPWESRFIRGAFGTDGDSSLSVGRGNGKSALVAALACAVVDPDGPLHGRRREVVCAASSFAQGRIIYEDCVAMMREKTGLPRRDWRWQDSANYALLEHRASGARIRCIGSDPKRAHGLRPALALLDEPAQWEAQKADKMLAAIRTGLGKVPGSRLIALGTQPADPEHWFSKLLASASYAQTHAPPLLAPPFRVATIRRANPSYDHLPSLRARLEQEKAEARRDPDALASWRSLRLNQGTSDVQTSTLLDAGTWSRIEVEAPAERTGRYALGLDLGQSAAMSASAAFWPQTGALETLACFPELPDLRERGLADGVGRLYVEMHARGELIVAGRRVSDPGELLAEALSRWGRPAVIVADRWREAELREVLERIGFPPAELVIRGQGFQDGGQDLREFRRACAGERVRPTRSLLLRASMAEARAVGDPAGNWKLAKNAQGGRRAKARDDAAAAAILAVAVGSRRSKELSRGKRRAWRVVR